MPQVTTPNQDLAAVVHERGGPFVLKPVKLGSLRHNEVAVRIVGTGMCHTDLIVRDGMIPMPLPAVLGHEGAGVVIAVGETVSTVGVGDHVVLSFRSCGHCAPCMLGHPSSCESFGALNFRGCRPDGTHALQALDGRELNDRFFSQSSFATTAVASERSVVRVRKDAPLQFLGPLGCGIQTGAGAVLNALQLPAGSTIAIFGSGAVGLSAVMAAKVAGAAVIIAVDLVPSRLTLAGELGATHTIDASAGATLEAIRVILPQGVHFALDTTGLPPVIRDAITVLRPRGTCGMVGASTPRSHLSVEANDIMTKTKRIVGIIEGDSVPQDFIPRLVELFMQGRFPIDRLIEFFPLENINDAAKGSETGRVIKPVVLMPRGAAGTSVTS